MKIAGLWRIVRVAFRMMWLLAGLSVTDMDDVIQRLQLMMQRKRRRSRP
jgi:hypothetical protein